MIQRPFNKLHGSASLPFVIPSEAEGSAVRPGSLTKVCVSLVLTQTLKPLRYAFPCFGLNRTHPVTTVPQRLEPPTHKSFMARLKPCPSFKDQAVENPK
jgi:hypothetical protein